MGGCALLTVLASMRAVQHLPVEMRRLSSSRAPVRRVMERSEWLPVALAHAANVARALGTNGRFEYDRADPVRNFVFEYYHFKPSHLRMWTPGPDVALRGVLPEDFGQTLPPARLASELDDRGREHDGSVLFAALGAPERQCATMRQALAVLRASASREPHLLCHGLHEWAMLYYPAATAEAGVPPPARHQRALPLRVSQAELNACVESVPLRCTHFDAFRFFTEPARPLNREGTLSREAQVAKEQPGCVHATMDLFKWTLKALPFVEAGLVVDTLALALQARVLDMRASPYDLRQWDLGQSARPSDGQWDEHLVSQWGGQSGACGVPADREATAPGDGWPAKAAAAASRGALPPLSTADLSPIRIETREGREQYRAYQHALWAESVPVRSRLTAQYERFFELRQRAEQAASA
jgi:hypothetical protein